MRRKGGEGGKVVEGEGKGGGSFVGGFGGVCFVGV